MAEVQEAAAPESALPPTPRRTPTSWVPHALPYIVFLVITQVAGYFEPTGPLVGYPIKLVLCAGLLLHFCARNAYRELRHGYRIARLPIDVLVGIAVFGLWIAPESIEFFKFGESTFDPNAAGKDLFAPLVVVRLVGAVLLVPVFEELFIRSFLPRFLDTWDGKRDWAGVAVGRFTPLSFWLTAILFGLAHHRWAVGIATGVVYNLYLMWCRNLWHVIAVHAVTNLALGIYVLQTQQWSFW